MAIDDDEANLKRKKGGAGRHSWKYVGGRAQEDAVASQATGIGGKYAWMTATNTLNITSRPKPPAAPSARRPLHQSQPPRLLRAQPYVSATKAAVSSAHTAESDHQMVVTLRDAMFVTERERGHGSGGGAARGWA